MQSNHLCECGCGEYTNVLLASHRNKGWIAGQPAKYIKGHRLLNIPREQRVMWGKMAPKPPVRRKENNHAWKGGRRIRKDGYITIICDEKHPVLKTYAVNEHIVIAEAALGKSLPKGSVIHHFNENRSDNRHQNLIICQDSTYHNLLHLRTRAYKAVGNANARPCHYCKRWLMPDDPERKDYKLAGGRWRCLHAKCLNSYMRSYKKQKAKAS